MMKNRSHSLITALVALFSLCLGACATVPPLSPQQRRSMQTRTFDDTSYENVFRSFKTVIQDDGYIIKNQDLQGGLIVATIEKTAAFAEMPIFIAKSSEPYKTSDGYEVSINLEKLGEKVVESRITIQQTSQYSQGGKTGKEILDEKLYKALYDRVKLEVERRKAQGKA